MKKIYMVVCISLSLIVFLGFKTDDVFADYMFDMDKVLSYVWEGNEAYQESVLVVEEEDGSISPIELLYNIEKVTSVNNASLTKAYEYGVDYSVENGKLIIEEDGNIPRLTYSEFHPTTGDAGFEARDGGYVLWKEGSWYHSRQIVVTYSHTDTYDEYIPEGKGLLLPNTVEKLKGEEINVLVYGDSISTGGNSSGHLHINVAPFMPIYPQLFCEGIKRTYGVETVNLFNPSQGGKDSAWGLSNLRSMVFDKYEKIDIAVLAFGMNDVTRAPDSYASNMKRMANGLKTKYEGIEILIVAPMLPNPDALYYYVNQPDFANELMQYEAEGVVVVNVTAVHGGIINKKKYADLTGNNVNHANDYLARIYAQTLLKTLEVSSYGEHIVEEEDSASSIAPSSDSNVSSEDSIDPSGKKGCGGGIGACGLISAVAVALAAVKMKTKKTA